MRTLLITNDDSIHSPGLMALKQAVEGFGKIIVIAPDRDNSAVSHSLTMDRPLKVIEIDKDTYMVNGTPTDCVALGIKKILDCRPALLLSGINAGANLGDDISYSGTVSAAVEGTMYSIPSMAVSATGDPPYDFLEAGKVARMVAEKILKNGLPDNTLVNINIPPEHKNTIRITRQGRRLWENSIQETCDPRGRRHYWIGGGTPVHDSGKDTDVQAIKKGCISITPVQLDLTSHSGIDFLKNNWDTDGSFIKT
ncbi:5'/3'-nucleotidase SurE [Desulfomarina sp.]